MLGTVGAFTRSDIRRLLSVINVESALPRQKDQTVFSGATSVATFCRARAVLPTTFMTGSKRFIPDRVNAPNVDNTINYNIKMLNR